MRKSLFLVALFLIATLSFNGVAAQNIAQGVRVVVIDAGHGGPKFPGAHYRGVYEKDLNLQIALKLGALIEKEIPQLKVVYTRKTDKQFSESLTQDLQARADIANKAGGDLFISIHTNAAASASARGDSPEARVAMIWARACWICISCSRPGRRADPPDTPAPGG